MWKSSQLTVPDGGILSRKKVDKVPLTGFVCLLTSRGLIRVRRGSGEQLWL
jgi:hypothetical protein